AAAVLGATGRGAAEGQKVRLGVLKLTSSAVLFLGAEKGYFKEFGVEPEFVFFEAAQPIAVALASGDLEAGATGLTAGLYNIVAGGVKIWIVADKGREWPEHNLTGSKGRSAADVCVRRRCALAWVSGALHYANSSPMPGAVAFVSINGYYNPHRHYFDSVLKEKSGPAFNDVVAITAKYTGARPE